MVDWCGCCGSKIYLAPGGAGWGYYLKEGKEK